jgi:hypothetical protein
MILYIMMICFIADQSKVGRKHGVSLQNGKNGTIR